MEIERSEVCDLSDVVLSDNSNNSELAPMSKKQPKRILHFSDGDLVEYSEDETDAPKTNKIVNKVDPKNLDWLPWAWHQTTWVSGKLLDGCDFMGEWLANFFGITAPKYQFEINEFYRLQALEKEMQSKQDLEMGGWNEVNKNNIVTAESIIQQ